MKYVLLLSFSFLSASASAGKDPRFCTGKMIDQTADLIAYMGVLDEQNLIGVKELERFVEGLKQQKLINPISENQRRTTLELHEPYEEFEVYLKSTNLDQSRLLEWVESRLVIKKNIKVDREITQKETQDIHHKMIFFPIPSGKYKIGNKKKKIEIDVPHSFEMMSTKITQKMWVEIMGVNPSSHTGHLDLPVENISWWSAVVFANKLSEKQGLKPAYDLTGVEWKRGTSAEAGTLKTKESELLVHEWINQHNHNVYETEGYRLPTVAEALYVRKNLGTADGAYYFGDSIDELKEHAWFYHNSNGETQPVAEKKPLTIDGHSFYDLHGLVFEWCWAWGSALPLTENEDMAGHYYISIGGSVDGFPDQLANSSSNHYRKSDRHYWTGLRLVRTLPFKATLENQNSKKSWWQFWQKSKK